MQESLDYQYPAVIGSIWHQCHSRITITASNHDALNNYGRIEVYQCQVSVLLSYCWKCQKAGEHPLVRHSWKTEWKEIACGTGRTAKEAIAEAEASLIMRGISADTVEQFLAANAA